MNVKCKNCTKLVRKRNAFHSPIEAMQSSSKILKKSKTVTQSILMVKDLELFSHKELSKKFNSITHFYCSSDCYLTSEGIASTKELRRSPHRNINFKKG